MKKVFIAVVLLFLIFHSTSSLADVTFLDTTQRSSGDTYREGGQEKKHFFHQKDDPSKIKRTLNKTVRSVF